MNKLFRPALLILLLAILIALVVLCVLVLEDRSAATGSSEPGTTQATQPSTTEVTETLIMQTTERTEPPATEAPTTQATEAPTTQATEAPTTQATEAPTTQATEAPTTRATEAPTTRATESPTTRATEAPTTQATEAPTTQATEAPVVYDGPVFPELTSFLGLEYKAMGVNTGTGWHKLVVSNLEPSSMQCVMEEYALLLAEYDLELVETVYDNRWNQYNMGFAYTGSYDVSTTTMLLYSYDGTEKIEHSIVGSFYLTFSIVDQDPQYYYIHLYCSDDFIPVVDGAVVSMDIHCYDEDEDTDSDDSDSEWRENCSRCHGSGKCTRCGGDGKVRKLLAGTTEWVDQKCTSCRPSGSGKCSSCGGKGYE